MNDKKIQEKQCRTVLSTLTHLLDKVFVKSADESGVFDSNQLAVKSDAGFAQGSVEAQNFARGGNKPHLLSCLAVLATSSITHLSKSEIAEQASHLRPYPDRREVAWFLEEPENLGRYIGSVKTRTCPLYYLTSDGERLISTARRIDLPGLTEILKSHDAKQWNATIDEAVKVLQSARIG